MTEQIYAEQEDLFFSKAGHVIPDTERQQVDLTGGRPAAVGCTLFNGARESTPARSSSSSVTAVGIGPRGRRLAGEGGTPLPIPPVGYPIERSTSRFPG